jgi:hypothetical protein
MAVHCARPLYRVDILKHPRTSTTTAALTTARVVELAATRAVVLPLGVALLVPCWHAAPTPGHAVGVVVGMGCCVGMGVWTWVSLRSTVAEWLCGGGGGGSRVSQGAAAAMAAAAVTEAEASGGHTAVPVAAASGVGDGAGGISARRSA